ncbi:MAG: GTPase ObgE [Cyanobacteria bacterium HKST-UBA04]|nr:GTPase ObgE [Cyanobacteria bacterium HKST-UBA04]
MQFIDQVRIHVASGSGGDGAVAWRREKYVPHGGPAGGDGGRGGDVVVEADHNLSTLLDLKYQTHYQAQHGEKGRSKNCHGKSGQDCVIKVPCGTVVMDAETGQPIADLVEDGQKSIIAFGGRGGRGNARFATSKRRSPQFADPGEAGVERELVLELKLIADVGIIGLPNAGKSTLISVISAAKPKIADYPFTTLTPNLGVVKKPSGDGLVVADIPGLIEGASQGAGLGHKFLRHVERTRFLLHLIDISSLAEFGPLEAFHLIQTELTLYNQAMAAKPQILVLTKADSSELDEPALAQLQGQLVAALQETVTHRLEPPLVYVISSLTRQGVEPLVNRLFELHDTLPVPTDAVELVHDTKAFANDDSAYEVVQGDDGFVISGGKLDRLVRVTDLRNERAVMRLTNIFKAMGLYKSLAKLGAVEGDLVEVGGVQFEYFNDD